VRRLTYLPLGVKFTAIIFAALVVAMGVVYLWVVPRLESRLIDAKLRELREAAQGLAFELDTRQGGPNPLVQIPDDRARRLDEVAQRIGGRATLLFQLNRRPGGDLDLLVFDDTNPRTSAGIADDPLAQRAARTNRTSSGRVERDGSEYAEVATVLPVTRASVLLLAAPIDNVVAGAAPIQRSVVVAGAIGLVGALLVGSLGAQRYVRRIRRLEAAAERIASGDLSVPVRVEGRDEIGQLAEAFENMRVRLEGLDRARREFVANASHELKTPLFALGGFLELMTEEELDEETRREFSEQMATQVERLTALTGNLLDLSRIDAGELPLEKAAVSIDASALQLVQEFAAAADASGHILEVGASEDVAAYGDEERIVRIGRALVENALRHTHPGTRIRVSAMADGDRGELRVSDNGQGIEPEDVARIFDRFYRGHGPAAHGSGLGLAIAREVAELMGGSLRVRRVGEETVFALSLARADEAAFSRENARMPALDSS